MSKTLINIAEQTVGDSTFPGRADLGSVSGDVTLDLTSAHAFQLALGGAVTIAIENASANPVAEAISLLVQSNANDITWPDSVSWEDLTPPLLTANGKDLIELVTMSGGIEWIGSVRAAGLDRVLNQYRYVRIYITGQAVPDYHQLDEIQVMSVPGGTNLCTPSTPASASEYLGGYEPSYLVDGVQGQVCSSVSSAWPWWVQVDLGQLCPIAEVTLSAGPYSYSGDRAPSDFVIQASIDGVSFDDLKSFSGVTWTPNQTQSFSLVS